MLLDEFTYIFFFSLKTPSPYFFLLFEISCSLSLTLPKFSFCFFFFFFFGNRIVRNLLLQLFVDKRFIVVLKKELLKKETRVR